MSRDNSIFYPYPSSFSDANFKWLSPTFTEKEFKCFGSTTSKSANKDKSPESTENTESTDDDATAALSVFTCPQEGCVRVFQRLSSLDKHLSLEKCTKTLEKYSLFDLAKIGYKSRLEDGVGTVPNLKADLVECSNAKANEGWALRAAKKYYRFSEKQKEYLNCKFEIGRSTGRKMNGETVAKQMRRAQGQDGQRLFKVSEFLSTQQIDSYFSRRAAKDRQGTPVDESDIGAYQEESNFAASRMTVLQSIVLEHPITYDRYNICTMVADGNLEKLKLLMLQNMCKSLELDVPKKDVRKKEPYKNLLKEAVSRCSCCQSSVE